MASSKRQQNNFNNGEKGCFKCQQNRMISACQNYIKQIMHFQRKRTRTKYPIGQHINCKSKNVIDLVTCNKCSLQYVESTSTELKIINHP